MFNYINTLVNVFVNFLAQTFYNNRNIYNSLETVALLPLRRRFLVITSKTAPAH